MAEQEDIEFVRNQKDQYYRYLTKAQEQVKKYEVDIEELKEIARVALCKQVEAEKDRDQMRSIMTQNITESNAKINLYVENIQTLKATVKGLKQGE